VASTLAYLALYALPRLGAGPQWANLIALLVTALANTAANRRLTFGVRGGERAVRQPQLQDRGTRWAVKSRR
jgi:putative flippase GtrA